MYLAEAQMHCVINEISRRDSLPITLILTTDAVNRLSQSIKRSFICITA